MIFLYEQSEKNFTTAGLCTLPDATSCTVTEERNGAYELEMQYPINGISYSSITARRIIFCRPNPYEREQPFRIYKISKPINGIVTVYAQHISYDLKGIPLSPFTAENILTAMQGFTTYAVGDQPFTFTTDKTTTANFAVTVPSSARSMLGGTDGSLLDVYGGEYVFDRYIVALKAARGENHGVEIRYGKNLTDVTQEENISKVATGVYPYWKSMTDDTLVMLPEKTLAAPGTYTFSHVVPLDLSTEWDEAPTEAQLRARAQKYMEDNAIGVPQVSLSVSFQPLADTVEYKDLAPLEEVRLCDTVTVIYPELGVSATAKVIRCVYNVLLGRYDKIDIGDARMTLADTIAGQGDAISNLPLDDVAKQATESSTNISQELQKLLANGMGLYTSTVDAENGGKIFYMHDKPTLAQSTNIWRIQGGVFAASSDGGNTWTAGFTTSGNSVAKIIQTEKIVSPVDESVFFDLIQGIIGATRIQKKRWRIQLVKNPQTKSRDGIGIEYQFTEKDDTSWRPIFCFSGLPNTYHDWIDIFTWRDVGLDSEIWAQIRLLCTTLATAEGEGRATISVQGMVKKGDSYEFLENTRFAINKITAKNLPEAGAGEAATMTDFIISNPSFIGTLFRTYDNTWYNVISCRHRNNQGDGVNYGLAIYNKLFGGDLMWYQQTGEDTYGPDRTIWDSGNSEKTSCGGAYGYGHIEVGKCQICWGFLKVTANIKTKWGSIYYCKTNINITYQQRFTMAPAISLSVESQNGEVIGVAASVTGKDGIDGIYVYSADSRTAEFWLHWQAFGLLAE